MPQALHRTEQRIALACDAPSDDRCHPFAAQRLAGTGIAASLRTGPMACVDPAARRVSS